MAAKTLMVQGTASHVGKSVLTTALCRILARMGFRVSPFKAVNMSNNAWVTKEGGEIAYAQAVQAWACGIEPTVQMNPVLLKPMAGGVSQMVVSGWVRGEVSPKEFCRLRPELAEAVDTSLQCLMEQYEVVVIEGAGSPAEVNLKEWDLANMRVARQVHAPVVLVADIERGGVFAQLVGTLELLEPEERALVKGFLINKFRGDPQILEPGLRWLEQRTGRPVLGVVPYLKEIQIPEEDSLAERLSGDRHRPSAGARPPWIQIVRYPTIANFTDFDPLHREPDIFVEYLTGPPPGSDRGHGPPEDGAGDIGPTEGEFPHLLILPGSKSTMADLAWLKGVGLDRHIARCVESGVEVLGICGGFQMLGQMLYDPQHLESPEAAMPGLGLLPTDTLFLQPKITAQLRGIHLESGQEVQGYEIHMGRIQHATRGHPVFRLLQRGGEGINEPEGCRMPDRPIWGTYLHGLFDAEGFRNFFLNRFRRFPKAVDTAGSQGDSESRLRRDSEAPYDRLADWVTSVLDREGVSKAIPWIRLD